MAGEKFGSQEIMQIKSKQGLAEGRERAKGTARGQRRLVEGRPGNLRH